MNTGKRRVLTVPNLLSLLRLLMIPVFVWCYRLEAYEATAVTLVLSGLTDMADGWYARRFHAVSDVGKVLDPVADKLTQLAMLLCLAFRHKSMAVLLILLLLKEIYASVSGAFLVHAVGYVPSAEWHGKVATLMLYLMMIVHVLWKDIPVVLSNTMIAACTLMLIYSMLLYSVRNVRALRAARLRGG